VWPAPATAMFANHGFSIIPRDLAGGNCCARGRALSGNSHWPILKFVPDQINAGLLRVSANHLIS
jgi:hypothetical protein